MNNLLITLIQLYEKLSVSITWFHHPASLAARLYVANVFFSAGLTKIQDWDTTLFLFAEEYQVPLLPYELAAFAGTFGELLFPILLIAGLGTRFTALALSVVNAVAVISLDEIAPAALYLHYIWGLLLAVLIVYGGGALSADRWLSGKVFSITALEQRALL